MKQKKEEQVSATKEKDMLLLERIQPAGGVTFKNDRYITTGTGYEACLTVIDFPSSLQDYWLQKLTKIDDVVTTIDVSTEDPDITVANINRSMKEQNQRARTRDYEEWKSAEQRKQELDMHFNELTLYEQVLKIVQPRIFIPAASKEKTDLKAGEVQRNLHAAGYETAVFLGEGKREWKSVYQSYKEQQNYQYAIYGQPMTAEALAFGNPFSFSALYDPCGIPLGTTMSGGDVMFDPGQSDEQRTHYNGVVLGNPGSGKSTLLKKLIKSLAVRGHFIRIFDIVGDYKELSKELGFKEVVYGKDGIINILHIYKGGETEQESYVKHVSKFSTFYSCLNPKASAKEISILEEQLDILYQKNGINVNAQVTGYPAERYPTLSDMVCSVKEEIDKMSEGAEKLNEVKRQIVVNNLLLLDDIRKTIENAVQIYGIFLDGKSSIENLQDEQGVDFNITGLKDVKGNIFDACIQCLFSLTWDNMISNGTVMKRRYENGEIEIEDVVRFFTFVDESHNWINTSKPFLVDECIRYSKEARKFFGGFWYVFHKAGDVMTESGIAEDAQNKLRSLFALTQYKFVFKQGNEDLEILKKLFGNIFTLYQSSKIPQLAKGHTILCISGMSNIIMRVALTREEEALFKGGV
ncbi:FtsK/SpoIIIE domain-containing protein [Roseburia hominis]